MRKETVGRILFMPGKLSKKQVKIFIVFVVFIFIWTYLTVKWWLTSINFQENMQITESFALSLDIDTLVMVACHVKDIISLCL